MKTKLMVGLLAAVCVAGLTTSAVATPYNITFTGGGWSAVGQVDVTGGLATSGYLNVTYGATTVDYNYLATGIGIVSDNNGDNLPYGDNLISLINPDFVDQNGLLFLTAPIIGGHSAGAGIYLSADQNNGYVPNLNGYGKSPGFGWGVPNVDGTATISAVPDGGSTFGLLGAGLVSLMAFAKRKMIPGLA
jgi:hypothetical protein